IGRSCVWWVVRGRGERAAGATGHVSIAATSMPNPVMVGAAYHGRLVGRAMRWNAGRVSPSERSPTMVRGRRARLAVRRVTVRPVELLSRRMVRLRLGGRHLEGVTVAQPAASVRLLVPSSGGHELVIPAWN